MQSGQARRTMSHSQRARQDAMRKAAADPAQAQLVSTGGILQHTQRISHEKMIASERKSMKRTLLVHQSLILGREQPRGSVTALCT